MGLEEGEIKSDGGVVKSGCKGEGDAGVESGVVTLGKVGDVGTDVGSEIGKVSHKGEGD
jgi:hypothetical protein